MPGARGAAVAAAGAVLSCLGPNKQEPDYLVRNGDEVRLVQVLHRHGARTPFRCLPGLPAPDTAEWFALWGQCRQRPKSVAPQGGATGAPLTSEATLSATTTDTYGPCGQVQLTQRGEEQLRRLGTWLRAEYFEAGQGQLFTSVGQQLEVFSTKTSRTLFSARALLLGLLPDVGGAEAEAMVKIGEEGGEILVAQYHRCGRLRQLFHEVRADAEASLIFVHTRKRLLELGNETRFMSLIEAGDCLRSLQSQGSTLPGSVPEGLADELDSCGHELVEAAHGRGSREMRRLAAGPLLADIHSRILAAVDGSCQHRCIVRSAHDVSVVGLMVALGLPVHRWPGFGSSVVIELLRELDSGDFKVRVVCHDGVPGDAGAVGKTLDMVVPLAAWRAIVEPLALSKAEYEEECRLPPGASTPPPQSW